jgi:large subunit ribosomal protein L30
MEKKIKVRYVHSVIGQNARQRATVRALGLRKIGQVAELTDTDAVRGMVRKISHLVSIVKEG